MTRLNISNPSSLRESTNIYVIGVPEDGTIHGNLDNSHFQAHFHSETASHCRVCVIYVLSLWMLMLEAFYQVGASSVFVNGFVHVIADWAQDQNHAHVVINEVSSFILWQ